jgi:PAS domain-containing protein
MGLSDPRVAVESPLPVPRSPATRTDSRERVDALHRTAGLIESSEDPVIGPTLDGLITAWNPVAERLYGYSVEAALRGVDRDARAAGASPWIGCSARHRARW